MNRSDVQALVKALSLRLGAGSVVNIYGMLSAIFDAAVDDRLIVAPPCRRMTLPKPSAERVDPPTIEQVGALADAMGRYGAAVILLAGSGLRIGELVGLRVEDIDFLRRELRVVRQRYQDGRLGQPKSATSIRTVPLGCVVVDELAQHLAAVGSREWPFTTSRGEPLSYRAWKAAWKTANARLGLDIDTHQLPHFFASALIAGGASVKQVQTVLGHSSPTVTLRVYAHLWPGDNDRTRSIIDTTLGGVLRTACELSDLPSDLSAGEEA